MTLTGARFRFGSVRFLAAAVAIAVTLASAPSAKATLVVSDTWIDGTRSDPTPANHYSENGTDSDADGDIESSWYTSPSANLAVVNASPGTQPGILRGTVGTSNSSWTTYFSPDNTAPVTLANAGDKMTLKWVFTPTTVATSGTGQDLRLAILDWPEGSLARITGNAAPGNGAYAGYGMFMNMKTGNLGNGNSFQLMERTDNATASAALSSSNTAVWTGRANGANTSTPGYVEGLTYTFTMTFERSAGPDAIGGNADDGLEISAVMAGSGLGGAGNQISTSFSDSTPNSFTYDTFTLRPTSAATTAAQFDTSLFQVEFVQAVPEISSFLMLGIVGAGSLFLRRLRRGKTVDTAAV